MGGGAVAAPGAGGVPQPMQYRGYQAPQPMQYQGYQAPQPVVYRGFQRPGPVPYQARPVPYQGYAYQGPPGAVPVEGAPAAQGWGPGTGGARTG